MSGQVQPRRRIHSCVRADLAPGRAQKPVIVSVTFPRTSQLHAYVWAAWIQHVRAHACRSFLRYPWIQKDLSFIFMASGKLSWMFTMQVWLKHDLRLDDHPGLVRASQHGSAIVPTFCMDPRLYVHLQRTPNGIPGRQIVGGPGTLTQCVHWALSVSNNLFVTKAMPANSVE